LINIVNYFSFKCNCLSVKLLRRFRAFAVLGMVDFLPEFTSKELTQPSLEVKSFLARISHE
jgi:hypothetical protein